MAFPNTRSGRPNTSGTRGGMAGNGPFPLAEEEYDKDNEQKFRKQLGDILEPVQKTLSKTAAVITALAASAVSNDSGVSGATVKAALDWLNTNLQPLNAQLTAIAALTTTVYGRSVLTQANAAALQSLAGLVIGTNVEAWSANLDAWSALATSAKQNALGFTPLNAASNLSDVANAATSRSNLSAEQLGIARGVNTQGASYTLVLADAGQTVEMNTAGASTLVVPLNVFAVGAYINFMQLGSGVSTVTPAGGVQLLGRNGLRTAGQYAMGTMYLRAGNQWIVGGDTVV